MRLDALLAETRGGRLTSSRSGAPGTSRSPPWSTTRGPWHAGRAVLLRAGRDGRRPRPAPTRPRAAAPRPSSWSARCRRPLPQLLARVGARRHGPGRRRVLGPPVRGAHGGRRHRARAARRPPPTCSHADLRGARLVVPRCSARSPGPRTTPEAPELQAHLAAERDAGRTSRGHGGVVARARHGPRARRPASPWPCSRTSRHDHLDFHRDLEDYFEAKAALFTPRLHRRRRREPRRPARRRAGPPRARCPPRATPSPTPRTSSWAPTSCDVPLARPAGRAAARRALQREQRPRRRHRGRRGSGSRRRPSPTGSAARRRVPGRFEPVDEGQPFAVLVDYAHKPGALDGALAAAREAAAGGRVLVVVGAGGDRDRSQAAGDGRGGRPASPIGWSSPPTTRAARIRSPSSRRSAPACPPAPSVAVEPDRAAAIASAAGRGPSRATSS